MKKNARNLLQILFYLLILSDFSCAFQTSSPFLPLVIYDPEQFDDSTPIFLSAQITVSKSVNLVTPDGYVVGEELCVGDKFSVKSSGDDGEFWDNGGHYDSPPIFWLTGVDNTAKEVLGCPGAVSGYAAQLRSTTLYPISEMGVGTDRGGANGRIACSLTQAVEPGGFRKEGDYYVAVEPGDNRFNASLALECMYYYVTGLGRPGVGAPKGAPTIVIEGAEFMFTSACNNIKPDLFKLNSIDYSKNIKIVKRGISPQVGLSVPIKSGDLKFGEANNLRVLVKNTGEADMKITAVKASSDYRFISCDSVDVKAGAQSECLIAVTPAAGQGLMLVVDYEYKSCGKTKTGTVSKVLFGSVIVDPTASAQVYGIDVLGDCRNSYYQCSSPDKDKTFFAGFLCHNTDNKYYTPSKSRFDLRFSLPDVSSGVMTGAQLDLYVSSVNKAQDVVLYSVGDGWTPVSCTAGGDICTQPYCPECAPLFDLQGASQVSSAHVSGTGTISFDVSDLVVQAYLRGDSSINLQVRGAEDAWTCDKVNDWTKQDVEFYGLGGMGPKLKIDYSSNTA